MQGSYKAIAGDRKVINEATEQKFKDQLTSRVAQRCTENGLSRWLINLMHTGSAIAASATQIIIGGNQKCRASSDEKNADSALKVSRS